MDYVILPLKLRSGKHLNRNEHIIIQTMLQNSGKRNISAIAKQLGRPGTTNYDEVIRGIIALDNGTVHRCKDQKGEETYRRNRKCSVRCYKLE